MNKQEISLHTDARDLSIQRNLGHKRLMPGSGQWQMQTLFEPDSCWYCNNYSYCLFFWNEEIGIFNEKNSIGIDKLNKLKLVETIRMHNEDTYMDHEEVPVLHSSCTGWRPKPFMTLMDFLETLEPSKQLDYA